ncbi:hypothetical protein Aasi_0346 [Candidatus Amoebophilus asiaticus 5a2]|uniref:BAG domain-containing protein n=1 Tax=Amoebophilus asiaticus (strain 5a2) TaxID=452471 RepID=B3ERC1_AMOA5|nr:hypothetical protein [Candidatus Amoebophilus asiaticus]ACE05773.1 hypothetical protein Aasi_0346 [Candidatus Amoebophilus asiaticus 5a2]
MYNTNKRIIAVILLCSQLLTTTSCSGNFGVPTQQEVTQEHKQVEKKHRKREDLSVSLPTELSLYTTEGEAKKSALVDESVTKQLQLVESNLDYSKALAPTIADNLSSVSLKEEQPSVVSRPKPIVTPIKSSRPSSDSGKPSGYTTSTDASKTLQAAMKEKKTIRKELMVPPASGIAISEQVTESQSPLMLIAKGGHQVYVDHASGEKAIVVANVPTKSDKYHRLQLPLVYQSANIDLLSLSKQPVSYQQNRVRICFPSVDTKGIGYVSVEDYGLKGGGRLSIDADEIIQAITRGYGTLGREPETMADWRSFLITFAQGLSSINLELTSVNNPSSFDPGNMRNIFLHMARSITGRNVQLENYGEAWSSIVGQARNKLRQHQRLNIDPSAYPRDSYTIVLRPNASRMRPFIGEMDRIYSTSNASESVRLNFDNILGAVDVEINLEATFRFFEDIQIERQENERRDQVRRIVDRVVGEVESIESDFINIKSHLQGLNLTDPSSSEDVKKIINTLKQQHEVLMRKLTVLDDLAGADEETRVKRKSLVGKVSSMLDEIDRFLRELHEALEKQQRQKNGGTWDSVTDGRISELYSDVQGPATNFINQTESEINNPAACGGVIYSLLFPSLAFV